MLGTIETLEARTCLAATAATVLADVGAVRADVAAMQN